jgi:NAD(P)-dependent dehydrogenase (short-subunit alcohol dehydrogenase family)
VSNSTGTQDNRIVVVTGAARGIGAAFAARFADEGATVIGADLQPPKNGDPRVTYEQVDVSSADEVAALFFRIRAAHGRLDVLVNNAGIWFRRPFREISIEEWDTVIGVNLRGTFLCTQQAVELMADSGGGTIVNIGSQAGLTVTRGQGAHYAATKAAISHLTKVLAFELGPLGIRVNCVAPGATPPDPSTVPSAMLAQIPLGRPGTPEDLTGAVAFLASEAAAYITGQTLLVNGGAIGLV